MHPAMLLSPLRFLPLEPAQLSLAAVLKCGQTFLWRKGRARATLPDYSQVKQEDGNTSHSKPDLFEWSYGHKDRTIVLRQDSQGIHYRSLFPPKHAEAHAEDLQNDTTLQFLRKYFVLDTSLPDLYSFWSARDPNFNKKTAGGTRFGGIRILRQPAWECLIEFICSSNNNIGRIEGMLRRLLALYGERLPCPAELESEAIITEEDYIYAFPAPSTLLGDKVTASLRTAGFGYRDAYVTRTAALVCEMAREAGYSTTNTEEWLETVSKLTEQEAREVLLTFSGVGPKVADCILLFGLGFEDVVPVDTHVYQIAVRDYGLKGSRDATVSKAMYGKIREKLQEAWGQKAGWAHQILFTADLRSFSDFEDPLLALETVSAAQLQVKKEAEDLAGLVRSEIENSLSTVKTEVKLEEVESTLLEMTTPTKRKRSAVSTSSAGSKTRKTVSKSSTKKTVKREISSSAAAMIYPTPPETPSSSKSTDIDYFGESPISLVERVKRSRTGSRTSPRITACDSSYFQSEAFKGWHL